MSQTEENNTQSLKKALIHRCIQIETRNGERMDV
jgi:hypothetical protein